jgi:Helix-turn-helix domain
MSLKALSWAFDIEAIPSSNKLVLLALANFSGETGQAYPSVETVGRITCQQDPTVRRALANLVELGIIKDTGKRVGATHQVKVYQLPEPCCERPIKTGVLKRAKTPARPPQDPRKTPENEGHNQEPGNLVTKEKADAVLFQEPDMVGPHRRFSDGWCSAYLKRFGAKYPYNGRDAKAAAELMKVSSPEELLGLLSSAWRQTDDKKFWACFHQTSTVSKFLNYLPTIRVELSREATLKKSGWGPMCP